MLTVIGPFASGVTIITAEHAFLVYKLMAKVFGAETIEVPDPGYVHDLDAMVAANAGHAAAYGEDAVTRRLERRFCDLFERDVAVDLAATGTAAAATPTSTITFRYWRTKGRLPKK